MKNLVFVACGSQSLHNVWCNDPKKKFDVIVAHYNILQPNIKTSDRIRHCYFKGTKFKIVHQAYEYYGDFDEYDAILVLDDDLFIDADSLNEFFDIFHRHELLIAQPSIIGWNGLLITNTCPGSILRYTNWVEIMCPCFRKGVFTQMLDTFIENKTDWGIEFIWNKRLNNPRDKIAIIDKVCAIHTRPCFYGDTYHLNKNTLMDGVKEIKELTEKYDLEEDRIVYSNIKITQLEYDKRPSEEKFFPPIKILEKLISSLRNKPIYFV